MKLAFMKLNKLQREKHRDAAKELIERLEHRLIIASPAKPNAGLSERVGACKEQLDHRLRDAELVKLNLELAELFYKSNNADKRKRPPVR